MISVKKNLSWNILLTVSGYLFPLLTFPYVTRILGADSLGLSNFALSIVDYAIIFANLGLATIGCRYIPQCNENIEKRNYVFSHLVTLHLVLSCIILVIYIGCVFFVRQLYEHKVLYFVGIAKIVSNVFLIEWLFQGMQDFRYVTIRTLIIRSLYVISIFLFVRHKEDYDIYFYLTIAQVVVNAFINWGYSKRFVKFRFSLLGCREYVFPVFSMGINSILLSFYNTFNIIFLGMVCDDASVGYFVTATKLYAIFLSFLSAYNGVFVPFLNSLFGRGEMEQFKKYVKYSFSIVILLSIPIVVGGIILAPEIIRLLAGPGYDRAVLPFQIVMIQVLLVGIAQILENQILLSLKKFKEVLICTSISTAIAILILFTFVPKYAEVASAYAVAIPHVVEAVLLYYFAKKSIDIKFPVLSFLRNVLACLPIAAICLIVRTLPINCFWVIVIAGTISVIYYFVMQYFVFKDEFVLSQLDRYISTLNNKHNDVHGMRNELSNSLD